VAKQKNDSAKQTTEKGQRTRKRIEKVSISVMPEEPAENRAQNKGGINKNELNSCKRHFKISCQGLITFILKSAYSGRILRQTQMKLCASSIVLKKRMRLVSPFQ
jgi:hypothetical protein